MSSTTSIPISFLKLFLLVIGLAYLLLGLFAVLFANRLSFPAPPAGYADSPNPLKFAYNEKGDRVSMLFIKNPESPYLIFYQHGNAEDLQSILPRLETLRDAGFSVLAWDYPGYGTSDGRPTEELVLDISEQIWAAIPESFGYAPEQIILYGRSLGGGPASWLASRHQAAGLILEGTFTSIFRVVTRVKILPWDLFDNLSLIGSIQCPVLFLHGTEDETVPFSHSRYLLENAPQPKFFAWFGGGRHNNLFNDFADTYNSSILRFKSFLENTGPAGR